MPYTAKTIKSLGELGLIQEYARQYKISSRVVVGIGDDAAVIKAKTGKNLVFTTDCLIEDVHFSRKEVSPYQIGWKAIGASLSDIAAMAASPVAGVISIGIPSKTSIGYVRAIRKGMIAISKRYKLDIVGGDTVKSSNKLFISVAIIGEIKKKDVLLRSGAKVGDKIVVTGRLGGSRFNKHYSFCPRVKEAQWLLKNSRPNSLMDITDGLGLDLYRIVSSSKVGARLCSESIPISKDAYKNSKNSIKNALEDGEDFELLFTVSKRKVTQLLKKWPFRKVPLTVIGEITKKKERIEIVDKNGNIKIIKPKGYEHF